jgi:hypothetical protein
MSTARGAIGGIFGEGKSAKRPVIVGADTKSIPAIEEDLNVMLRIIDKAAGGRDEKATAMGVPLDVFNISANSGSPRAFYLDGYGAMFLTKVKFPLLAPAKAEETRTNDATNSEWERARQEVYGGRSPEAHNAYYPPAGEPFDEQRVENLKTQLIDDLANATHIRNLKPDEAVTVIVLGSGSRGGSTHNNKAGQQMRAYASAANGRSVIWQSSNDGGAQTTMTLRAKKSDVDAFAKGKLKSEEFRKKVSVQVY